ncbi:MAG: GNAT family N-acetyltransferase [Candidatus Promineifilaceae bacterium]
MSSDAYTLRPASAKDYDYLFALHKATIRPYVEAIWGWVDEWQEEYFRKKFNPSNQKIIQINGKDIGVVVVEDRGSYLYLALIEITPAYQGQGIGTAVIHNLQQRARQEKRPLRLHVLKSNLRARQLYEQLGFVISNEEPIRWEMTFSSSHS